MALDRSGDVRGAALALLRRAASLLEHRHQACLVEEEAAMETKRAKEAAREASGAAARSSEGLGSGRGVTSAGSDGGGGGGIFGSAMGWIGGGSSTGVLGAAAGGPIVSATNPELKPGPGKEPAQQGNDSRVNGRHGQALGRPGLGSGSAKVSGGAMGRAVGGSSSAAAGPPGADQDSGWDEDGWDDGEGDLDLLPVGRLAPVPAQAPVQIDVAQRRNRADAPQQLSAAPSGRVLGSIFAPGGDVSATPQFGKATAAAPESKPDNADLDLDGWGDDDNW